MQQAPFQEFITNNHHLLAEQQLALREMLPAHCHGRKLAVDVEADNHLAENAKRKQRSPAKLRFLQPQLHAASAKVQSR